MNFKTKVEFNKLLTDFNKININFKNTSNDMFLKFKDALTERGWTISNPVIEL
jgi:hypothetical protein